MIQYLNNRKFVSALYNLVDDMQFLWKIKKKLFNKILQTLYLLFKF